jgi:hypothetical protein
MADLERKRELQKAWRAANPEYQKAWKQKNKEKLPKYQKKYQLKYPDKYKDKCKTNRLKKYGISLEDYHLLIKAQNGICPICGLELCSGGQIDVDHCHLTGKVRGILHNKCNRLLACCEESTTRLSNAIEYLDKHKEVK